MVPGAVSPPRRRSRTRFTSAVAAAFRLFACASNGSTAEYGGGGASSDSIVARTNNAVDVRNRYHGPS